MKRQNKKYRWNFIDTLILILVVLTAIGVAIRAYTVYGAPKNTDTATVYFEAEGLLPEVTTAALTEEIFTLFGKHTARVGEIGEAPSELAVYEESAVRYAPSLLSRRIYGTLSVSGRMTDGGFLLGSDTYFVPGMEVDMVGERVFLHVSITKIEF